MVSDLRNKKLYDLHFSTNIFRVIKSTRMRWAGHKARTGFWWLDLRGKRPLGRLGVDGRIILKWIFEKWGGWHGLD